MKNNGIVVFATEEARKNYVKKEKKNKKAYCPSCEIQQMKNTNCINKEIKEDILKKE
jgi:hypothetical protein